jgi:hypothetical protein
MQTGIHDKQVGHAGGKEAKSQRPAVRDVQAFCNARKRTCRTDIYQGVGPMGNEHERPGGYPDGGDRVGAANLSHPAR